METASHTLCYGDSAFSLSRRDHDRLVKVYSSGLSISSVLFTFTPVDTGDEVTIAIGSGATLILRPVR